MGTGIATMKRTYGRKADKYFVPVIWKTFYLMEYLRSECDQSEQEGLTLKEIVNRTGIPHTTAFRILHTLVAAGQVSKLGQLYRSPDVPLREESRIAS